MRWRPPRSGWLVAPERLDLFEPLLQLLVVVAQLVDVLAQLLAFLDAAAALADRRDRLVSMALDAAVEIAICEPSQSGQRALVANLSKGGRDSHPHHEFAIVNQRRHEIENFNAPVILERRKSRQRPDRGHAGASRPAVRGGFASDVDCAL